MDQDQQRDHAEERYNELIDHDELDPPEALTSADPRVTPDDDDTYDVLDRWLHADLDSPEWANEESDEEDERLAREADARLLGGWS